MIQSPIRTNEPFILPYDDYSSLPLPSTANHHHVIHGTIDTALQDPRCQGRILLLVFPPPGSMAREAVEKYVQHNNNNNNNNQSKTATQWLVYVGEGRGGANADESFFHFLEQQQQNDVHSDGFFSWELTNVVKLNPFGKDKGFERLFVFKRSFRKL